MIALDLTREAAREVLPPGVLPSLELGPLALALATWRGRMENEHASSLVFAGLLGQAVEAGASARDQADLAQMILEEQHHARRCAAMLKALGGEPVGRLPPVRPLPRHEDTTRRLAYFRNLLSVCCLSETVAVALIDAERLALEGAVPGQVLKEILADEVGHARFGWRTLEAAGLTAEELADLDRYLQTALPHLVAHELAHLSPLPVPTEALAEAGVCDGALARDVFWSTVEEVIVPSLKKLGLSANRNVSRHAHA
ncbi:MAG: ferritin-like domain-containing protein [Deltaproteobacteria bacterium]|nr:ferritin-like domain-containing protein [Deltaproteobacteria bacterium]